MKDDSYEDDELHREDLENRLKKMASNCKDKYRFLLKAGDGLKNCVFRLFSQVWKDEVKPQQWRNTVIIQLYKSKGEACCFDNQHNIHTKEEVPKLFEGIVVDKSKENMIDNCSKFQPSCLPSALRSV